MPVQFYLFAPALCTNVCKSLPSIPISKPRLVQIVPHQVWWILHNSSATSMQQTFIYQAKKYRVDAAHFCKTGIGSFRWLAQSNNLCLSQRNRWKPTAFVCGYVTMLFTCFKWYTMQMAKIPSGRLQAATALKIALATSSLVPGCAGCAFNHRATGCKMRKPYHHRRLNMQRKISSTEYQQARVAPAFFLYRVGRILIGHRCIYSGFEPRLFHVTSA